MKPFLITIPFLTIACSDYATTRIPIIKVDPLFETKAALKTALPSAPESLEVSFESLPGHVRQYNLGLAAARKLVAEAEGKLQSSGLASNPDLEVGFETDQDFGDLMLTVGVSRKFPRTNRLLLEKKVSGILVQAARAEVRDAERLVIGKAREALVEILALKARKTLLKSREENAAQFTKIIEASANRGEASTLEAGVARLEAIRLGNQASQIEIKEQVALARLKPLVGMNPEGRLAIAGSLAEPVMPPMNVTTYRRPDLEAARYRVKSAEASAELARSSRLDDFEAGIYAGIGREEDAPTGRDDEQIVGIRFKIPFGENPVAIGKEAEASARQERLELGARALEKVIHSESHAAYAEMKQWQALAEQMKSQLLPLADAQIETAKESYLKGEVPLRDVLKAQDQKLSLETAHLESRRDFHLAYSKYLTATAQ